MSDKLTEEVKEIAESALISQSKTDELDRVLKQCREDEKARIREILQEAFDKFEKDFMDRIIEKLPSIIKKATRYKWGRLLETLAIIAVLITGIFAGVATVANDKERFAKDENRISNIEKLHNITP